eukprot:NODE_797_length_3840_cov_0.211708.p1 type:complete len:303 gc:universal NODE_797_length_3840_cov_0.211708:2576-3484(+)
MLLTTTILAQLLHKPEDFQAIDIGTDLSSACTKAVSDFTVCLNNYGSKGSDQDKCTSCASKYSDYKSACSIEIAANNYQVFNYDVICHQENGVYCNTPVNNTQGTFNCNSACHKYASNFVLSGQESVGYLYSKAAKKTSPYFANYWNLEDMVSCLDTGCVKSTWNRFSCVYDKFQFLDKSASEFSTAIASTCSGCDPSDFQAQCKWPYKMAMAYQLDQICHKENGEFCYTKWFDVAGTGKLNNFTCSACDEYLYTSYLKDLTIKGDAVAKYAESGYNSTSFQKCASSGVTGMILGLLGLLML